MKKKHATLATHGGPRPGAGRPADPATRRRSVSVALSPAERAHCEQLGGGSVGAGVRLLIARDRRRTAQ